MDIEKSKMSLYCWIILSIFIAGTMVFMVKFYNKAVREIETNAGLADTYEYQ